MCQYQSLFLVGLYQNAREMIYTTGYKMCSNENKCVLICLFITMLLTMKSDIQVLQELELLVSEDLWMVIFL